MTACRNFINQIAKAMHVLSGVLLISMMLVTLIDVLTRTLYGLSDGAIALTFIGGVELIKYGLLFTILFTLPQSVGDAQVVVDLFTDRMSERAKIYLESFYLLGFALLGAGMTYRFYDAIESALLSGETTQDLMIPMPWVYRIVVFATAMLTLRCLLLIWELIRSHHRNQDTTTEAHATSLPHSNQQHKEVM